MNRDCNKLNMQTNTGVTNERAGEWTCCGCRETARDAMMDGIRAPEEKYRQQNTRGNDEKSLPINQLQSKTEQERRDRKGKTVTGTLSSSQFGNLLTKATTNHSAATRCNCAKAICIQSIFLHLVFTVSTFGSVQWDGLGRESTGSFCKPRNSQLKCI